MSTVPSYFKDFLSNIRLSDNQVKDLKTGHTTLRTTPKLKETDCGEKEHYALR